MLKLVRAASLGLAIVFTGAAFGQQEATVLRDQVYDLTVSLPTSRFSSTVHPSTGKPAFQLWARDALQRANTGLTVLKKDEWGIRSMEDYAVEILPGSLKRMAENHPYSVIEERRLDHRLGSGQSVKSRYYRLNINGQERHFVFFWGESGGIGFWGRISNYRLSADISDELPAIFGGMRLGGASAS